jgi:hypothetical protein
VIKKIIAIIPFVLLGFLTQTKTVQAKCILSVLNPPFYVGHYIQSGLTYGIPNDTYALTAVGCTVTPALVVTNDIGNALFTINCPKEGSYIIYSSNRSGDKCNYAFVVIPHPSNCIISMLPPFLTTKPISSGIEYGNPNSEYFYGAIDCNISPVPIITNSEGNAMFTTTCQNPGNYNLSLRNASGDECKRSFKVDTSPILRPDINKFCDSKGNPTNDPSSGMLLTAIGCIPLSDQNAFITFVVRWFLGISGGISFVLIVYSGFLYMSSGGDKQKVGAAKELITATISGLVLIIFSVFILDLIGIRILRIPGL